MESKLVKTLAVFFLSWLIIFLSSCSEPVGMEEYCRLHRLDCGGGDARQLVDASSRDARRDSPRERGETQDDASEISPDACIRTDWKNELTNAAWRLVPKIKYFSTYSVESFFPGVGNVFETNCASLSLLEFIYTRIVPEEMQDSFVWWSDNLVGKRLSFFDGTIAELYIFPAMTSRDDDIFSTSVFYLIYQDSVAIWAEYYLKQDGNEIYNFILPLRGDNRFDDVEPRELFLEFNERNPDLVRPFKGEPGYCKYLTDLCESAIDIYVLWTCAPVAFDAAVKVTTWCVTTMLADPVPDEPAIPEICSFLGALGGAVGGLACDVLLSSALSIIACNGVFRCYAPFMQECECPFENPCTTRLTTCHEMCENSISGLNCHTLKIILRELTRIRENPLADVFCNRLYEAAASDNCESLCFNECGDCIDACEEGGCNSTEYPGYYTECVQLDGDTCTEAMLFDHWPCRGTAVHTCMGGFGTAEVFNGVDDDCDTIIDEGLFGSEFCNGRDDDGDGRCDNGFECCRGTIETRFCLCGGTESRTCSSSCGWSSWSGCPTLPDEICNGIDDDCDGVTDEGLICSSFDAGTDARDAGSDTRDATDAVDVTDTRDIVDIRDACECTPGNTSTCTTSCGTTGSRTCSSSCLWGVCRPPSESCNSRDDDCDGLTDEDFECIPGMLTGCVSACGIGTRRCTSSCTYGPCQPPAEICDGVDNDCDGSTDEDFECRRGATGTYCTTSCGGANGIQRCSDSCHWTCPPPAEECNRLDDDCDGRVDNGFECSRDDRHSCTTSSGAAGVQICTLGCYWGPCEAIPIELCDAIDNDRDGLTDEDFFCIRGTTGPCGCRSDLRVTGTTTCNSSCVWGSCVFPSVEANCVDGLDNDCDGRTDCSDSDCSSSSACRTCTDADRDGYYRESGCGTSQDCDDSRSSVYPGATESCTNSRDDDCDGATDCADSNCSSSSACLPDDYCTSGDCCDRITHRFKPSGTRCASASTTFLRCSGSGCGSDVINQVCPASYCTGSSPDCPSVTCSESRVDCSSSQQCSSGNTSCVSCSSCTPSTEVCNGRDDDCDTHIDNGISRSCTRSDCPVARQACVMGSWTECVCI